VDNTDLAALQELVALAEKARIQIGDEWGPMADGPQPREPWEPWTAHMEAAPGLTIGSRNHTELLCRVSGYLRDAPAIAKFICAAGNAMPVLARLLEAQSSDAAHQDIGHIDDLKHIHDCMVKLEDKSLKGTKWVAFEQGAMSAAALLFEYIQSQVRQHRSASKEISSSEASSPPSEGEL
jgi:hypothetical protein